MPGFQKHIHGVTSALFGPIEFDCTDGFDLESIQKVVRRQFERTFHSTYEKCIHDFHLQIGPNKRDLSKPSQILRYSRNVQDLVLVPRIPEELPPEPEEEEEEQEEEPEDDE